ncbi:MAG: BlaI/MecI/CopY family transcriptional regulator [Planctomycetota bacterium]
MTPERPSVSPAELEALKVLWDHGASTVREVWASMPEGRWVYTTVQTLLQRLEAKGFVASHKRDRLRVYIAAVTREDLALERLDSLSRELYGGATAPLVHGLVSGAELSATEIQGLRDLLDELEPQAPGRDGGKDGSAPSPKYPARKPQSRQDDSTKKKRRRRR